MKKKFLAMVMAWVLVLQVISGAGFSPVSANESSSSQGIATVTGDTYGTSNTGESYNTLSQSDSILTKVTVKDSAGTVIDAVYNPDRTDRSRLGDAVSIEYEWALENGHSYKDGDVFEFDIPKEFKFYNPVSGQLVIGDGLSFGDFTIDINGHAIIEFNTNVQDYSEVSGLLEVHTEFNSDTITGSVEVPIHFPIRGGEQVVKVTFEPEDGKPLSKSGVANKDTKIDWNLDVNTTLNTINNAVVTDQIPQGLTLDPSSIHVYELQVNLDRAPDLGAEVSPGQNVYTLTTEADGSAFRLEFTEPSMNSAYRIIYSTLVTGEEEISFTNAAELKDRNGTVARESKTVTIKREKFVTKEAGNYNQATQTVSWTVKYNYGEKSIPKTEASIQDRFNTDMELVAGSVKVYEAWTGDTVDATLYNVTPVTVNGQHGFDLQFVNDISSAYNISYETKATGRVYQNTTVTNNVYSELAGKETIAMAKYTLRSGIGVKSIASTDYSTKEITWRIVVNRDQWSMTNLVIEDTFSGGGLEYIPGSLNIASSGDPVLPYTEDASNPKQGIKLSFTGTFADTYTFTYKTKFDPEKSVFGNTAELEWTEKTSQYPDPVIAQYSFTPNTYTVNNGYKNGQYDARQKKITWDVIANYNGLQINGAEFTDELQEGQKLLTDSIKVYQANVQANGSVQKSSEIVLDPSQISYNGKILTIHLGNMVSPYWITFDTKLDNTLVADEIPNTAVLTGQGGKSWSWDKKITIPHGEVYVSKIGERNGVLIDWEIKINEGQSYVENARIVDTPSSNQILLPDSFKLYKGDVAANGTVTPGEFLTEGIDYNLIIRYDEVQDQESFELSFGGPIDTAYVLQYSSEIAVSVDREQVINEVGFTGEGVTVGVQETSQSIEIRFSSGSGTGSGVRGALTVTKVDEDDPSIALSGAKYELRDSGERVIGEKVTDDLGRITFTKLLYDTYTLIETDAPQGYLLDNTAYPVLIDSTVQKTGGVKSITLKNKKAPEEPQEPQEPQDPGNPSGPGDPAAPAYQLEIIKVDSIDSSIILEGATFVLQDQGQQEGQRILTTDPSGKVVFTGLKTGQYTLVETAAPEGYAIDSTVRNVTIGSEGTKTGDTLTLTLIIANRKETVPPVDPGAPVEPEKSDNGDGQGKETEPDSVENLETDKTSETESANPSNDEQSGSTTSGQISDSGKAAEQNQAGAARLPQTGERSALPLQLIGLAIMLLGIGLKFRKKWSQE